MLFIPPPDVYTNNLLTLSVSGSEIITKTIRCENTDFLEVEHWTDKRGYTWKAFKRVEW